MPDPTEQPDTIAHPPAEGAEATYATEAAEHPGETYAEQADRHAKEAQAAKDAAPTIRITDPRIGHMAALAATGAEAARDLREAARAHSAMRLIYAEICQVLLSEAERELLDTIVEQGAEKFKDSVADFTVQVLVDKAVEEGVILEAERVNYDYLAERDSGVTEVEFADKLEGLQQLIEEHEMKKRMESMKDNPIAKLLGLV